MSIIQAGESCIGCGLCAKVCPIKIISMTTKKRPEMSEENSKICLDCGQCVAVCPKHTLSHDSVGSEKVLPMPEGPEGVKAVVKNRRSIRHFTGEEVSTDLLKEVMDTVRYAPTGGNAQPIRWTILRDREIMDKLIAKTVEWMKDMIKTESELLNLIPMQYFVSQYESGNERLSYNAPCMVIAHADENYWHGYLDCTIAMSYLEIVASSHKLGVCWAGALDLALKNSTELRRIAGIPEGEMNHNVLLVGKAKHKYPQIPGRDEAKINWM